MNIIFTIGFFLVPESLQNVFFYHSQSPISIFLSKTKLIYVDKILGGR